MVVAAKVVIVEVEEQPKGEDEGRANEGEEEEPGVAEGMIDEREKKYPEKIDEDRTYEGERITMLLQMMEDEMLGM
jgi:hypothetical protein